MTAPTINAPRPHVHGKRRGGTMNMQKPVDMPRGGITIFFIVTGVCPSRMRQASTPIRPTSETTAVMTGLLGMKFAFRADCDGMAPFQLQGAEPNDYSYYFIR